MEREGVVVSGEGGQESAMVRRVWWSRESLEGLKLVVVEGEWR